MGPWTRPGARDRVARRRLTAVTAGVALLLSGTACTGVQPGRWSGSDVYFATTDGSTQILVGVDLDADTLAAVTVADLGRSVDLAGSTVLFGGPERVVLLNRSDGRRLTRRLDPQSQRVGAPRPLADSGTVALDDSSIVTTTPEVAGPVRVQVLGADGKLRLRTEPLSMSPVSTAARDGRVVVVGSTRTQGTVLQTVLDGRLRPARTVAARALPGGVAVDGDTIAVALNRALPEGVAVAAKVTLPGDHRIALLTKQDTRVVSVATSPNHVVALGNGVFAFDAVLDGRRVIQTVSGSGRVRTLARLEAGDPVVGLTYADGSVVTLQASTLTAVRVDDGDTRRLSLDPESTTDWASAALPRPKAPLL